MLSAHTGKHPCPDRIGTDLPRKVDLQSRIDRHYFGVLHNPEREIGPCDIFHDNVLVVVHIIVQALRTQCQRSYGFAGEHFFKPVVNHPALDQRYYAVGHGFGMQSQILVRSQSGKYGIGDAADPDLQRRAVGNLFGDITSYFLLLFIGNGYRQRNQRFVYFHTCVDPGNMNQRIAIRERHLLIDLGYDHPRTFDCRNSQIGRDTITAIPLFVGGRDIQEGNVERHKSIPEERGYFAQETRNALPFASSDSVAHTVGNEETDREKRFAILTPAIRGFAPSDSKTGIDFHAPQLSRPISQSIAQYFGNGGTALYIYAVVRLDQLHRIGGCHVFGFKHSNQIGWFVLNMRNRSSSSG